MPYYNPVNVGKGINSGRIVDHRSKQARAEQKNARHDGRWLNNLKKLKNLNSIDFENLVHAMAYFSPKNLSKEQKIIAGIALAVFATGVAYGVANHISNQQNKMDKYNPRIWDLNYNRTISSGVPHNVTFRSTDVVDAYNNTSTENIAKAVVEVSPPEGVPINVTAKKLENNLFSSQFSNTEKEGAYPFRVITVDKAGNPSVKYGEFEVISGDKQNFLKWALDNGYPKNLSVDLYDRSSVIRQSYKSGRLNDLKRYLRVATINGSRGPKNIAIQYLQQIENDDRVEKKLEVASETFKLVEELGTYNLKRRESVSIPGNWTLASSKGLPKQDNNVVQRLIRASEIDPSIVNFSPIIYKSVNSSDVYLIPIPSRETWITTGFLERIKDSGFDILNHPEMFLGLNVKVIANTFSLFDDPHGISYYDKNITVVDPRVLDLIMLQWDLKSQFAPQFNGSDMLYNRNLPWYNSTELREMYSDMNKLRAELFKLFKFQPATYSIKDGKMIAGIEGAKVALSQSFEEYKNIVALLDDESLMEFCNKRFMQWLTDRYAHGVQYTTGQFLGFTDDDIDELNITLQKGRSGEDVHAYGNLFKKLMEERYGIDQFLTENWEYWLLVRRIVGYERGGSDRAGYEGAPESYVTRNILPGVFRMFGFPTSLVVIDPTPSGASGSEWTISLPPYVAEGLKKKFPEQNIYFDPEYGIGLYSCGDGLIKERGIDSTNQPINHGVLIAFRWEGNKRVYIMKRD